MTNRFALVRAEGRLELKDTERDDDGGFCLDLTDVRRRLRQGRRLALAKACGVRPQLSVLDAMAGFGLDGITLAALGCRVLMVERDPTLFELLQDAVARAHAERLPLGPIECRCADARDVLAAPAGFDTVYFDPMFPQRFGAALPRKSAQLLATHIGASDADLPDLVRRARLVARGRVVVKRRRRDPPAARPDWQITGRTVRFDVYRGSADVSA